VLNEHGLAGIDAVLHTLRGVELSRMPQVEGTMLSSGCAGSLCFRWIESSYGPVKRHIGVEFYTPKPDDLPPGVEWVKSTVADMQGVEDSSVELVYSGQNFEHLFGDDAVGFLLESRRVLPPGGWLVIDSPNRAITAALTFDNPQTAADMRGRAEELKTALQQAGFDVGDKGLSFQMSGGQQQWADGRQAETSALAGRAFAAATDKADDLLTAAAEAAARMQRRGPSGVDIRI